MIAEDVERMRVVDSWMQKSHSENRRARYPMASLKWIFLHPTTRLRGSQGQCPVTAAGSSGRCNTIWYNAVFKGGVYDPREPVWAFCGAEGGHVAPLEGGP